MRLTINQLRRIIKEEVSTVLRRSRPTRRLREMQEGGFKMEIFDALTNAQTLGHGSPEKFLLHLKELVSELGLSSVEFGGANALAPGDGYSEEDDTILIYGSKEDLTELGEELNRELMGGDGFTALIEPA